MRLHYSQDDSTDITAIRTSPEQPDSAIYFLSKTHSLMKVSNARIFEFLYATKLRALIDQHLFDMVKEDYPHLFTLMPTLDHIESLHAEMSALVVPNPLCLEESTVRHYNMVM
jgi:hypothetical protein